jgi:hypothetical protein
LSEDFFTHPPCTAVGPLQDDQIGPDFERATVYSPTGVKIRHVQEVLATMEKQTREESNEPVDEKTRWCRWAGVGGL